MSEASEHQEATSYDYVRVARAIRFIHDNVEAQPTLDDVADHLGLSPFYVQRMFSRWAGISPKKFLQYLTVERAKELLEESEPVLEATWATGLSSPSRLHDHFVSLEAVTPGEYKSGGEGLEIGWGVHDSPFGECFIAATGRGVCRLSFPDADAGVDGEIAALEARWQGATVREASERTARLASRIFDFEDGRPDGSGTGARPLTLHVQGTNFQVQVWKALLRIPEGRVVTYEELAGVIDRPRAVRAVAGAVARNPVSYLVPCHRVLRKVGEFGGYRWGQERKVAMLARESARVAGFAGS